MNTSPRAAPKEVAGASARRRLGAAAALLLLAVCAGCTSPEVRFQPVEVKVPIIVPCAVRAVDEPDWELKKLPADADDFAIAKAARADLRKHEQYERELRAAAEGCAKKGTP